MSRMSGFLRQHPSSRRLSWCLTFGYLIVTCSSPSRARSNRFNFPKNGDYPGQSCYPGPPYPGWETELSPGCLFPSRTPQVGQMTSHRAARVVPGQGRSSPGSAGTPARTPGAVWRDYPGPVHHHHQEQELPTGRVTHGPGAGRAGRAELSRVPRVESW